MVVTVCANVIALLQIVFSAVAAANDRNVYRHEKPVPTSDYYRKEDNWDDGYRYRHRNQPIVEYVS